MIGDAEIRAAWERTDLALGSGDEFEAVEKWCRAQGIDPVALLQLAREVGDRNINAWSAAGRVVDGATVAGVWGAGVQCGWILALLNPPSLDDLDVSGGLDDRDFTGGPPEP